MRDNTQYRVKQHLCHCNAYHQPHKARQIATYSHDSEQYGEAEKLQPHMAIGIAEGHRNIDDRRTGRKKR